MKWVDMSEVRVFEKGINTNRHISLWGLNHFLRWGFVPNPGHIVSGASLNFQVVDHNADKERRIISNFCGSRTGYVSGSDTPTLKMFERTLLESVRAATEGHDNVVVMASGGKDSISLAWAVAELGKRAILLHCRTPNFEDESNSVRLVAEQLGHDYLEIFPELSSVDSFLSKHLDRLPLPIADVAFFSYVAAVEKISTKIPNQRVVVLDGMGNDGYMGHIPGSREKRIIRLPRVSFSEKFISKFYGNDILHYGLESLSKNKFERLFSGSGFSVSTPSAAHLNKVFSKLSSTPEFRRAQLRGGIFDLDCCIAKGVFAAKLKTNIELKYPYLDQDFLSLFNKIDSESKFNYQSSFNKLILRRFLKSTGLSFEFSDKKKGSFRCDLSELGKIYTPSQSIRDVLRHVGIDNKILNSIQYFSSSHTVAANKLSSIYILDKFLSFHDMEVIDNDLQSEAEKFSKYNSFSL